MWTTLLISCVALVTFLPGNAEDCNQVGLVSFVLDGSDSLSSDQWMSMTKVVQAATGKLKQAITYVTIFSSDLGDTVEMTNDAKKAPHNISTMARARLGRNTHKGLEKAESLLANKEHYMLNKCLVLFMNGRSSDVIAAVEKASDLKNRGVTILEVKGQGVYLREAKVTVSKEKYLYNFSNSTVFTNTLVNDICDVLKK